MKKFILLRIIFFIFIIAIAGCDILDLLQMESDSNNSYDEDISLQGDFKESRVNPVKVFILAGQSNMEGKGFVEPKQSHIDKNGGKGTLKYLYNKNKSEYKYLVDSSGKWSARNDVWLVDVSKQGALKADFNSKYMGPELQFGHELGNYYKNNQVLLIKTAWGGKSLYVNFRPPSSGGKTGENYNEMIKRVREVLGNIKKFYPDYNGQGYELVGFGWHQGWNDRVKEEAVDEYKKNCVNLINDLRKEFKYTKMPFVLANTGMGGWTDLSAKAEKLMNDQMAVPGDSSLNSKENVGAVETRDFYIDSDDSPNGFTFHWNCNAKSYLQVGGGMGKKMISLLKNGGDDDGNDDGNDGGNDDGNDDGDDGGNDDGDDSGDSKIVLRKNTYDLGERIRFKWSGFDGNKNDWIGLFKKGDSNKKYILRKTLRSKESGKKRFKAKLEVGQYELRGFFNGSYVLRCKASFNVVK